MLPLIKHTTKKSVILFVLFLVPVLAIWSLLAFEGFPGHAVLQSWLLEKLVSDQSLPPDFDMLHTHAKKVIYVLGGSQESLRSRFKTAARLYQKVAVHKIVILDRPGIAEYDPSLERNLTNNEWAIKRLEELGVQKKDIESISIANGLFGTLNEARGVSQEVTNKGYDALILVSSPYHTARVRETFAKYLHDKKVEIFIYGSDDHPCLLDLLIEYFKFIVYKNILL